MISNNVISQQFFYLCIGCFLLLLTEVVLRKVKAAAMVFGAPNIWWRLEHTVLSVLFFLLTCLQEIFFLRILIKHLGWGLLIFPQFRLSLRIKIIFTWNFVIYGVETWESLAHVLRSSEVLLIVARSRLSKQKVGLDHWVWELTLTKKDSLAGPVVDSIDF